MPRWPSCRSRGRPPQAAARRGSRKLLTDTRRSGTAGGRWHVAPAPASRSPLRTSSWLLAVIPRRPGRRCRRPTGSPPAPRLTSTTDRALPSSAVQLRCGSRPMTSTRLPLLSDSAACFAWSRHDHGEERRRTTLLLPPTRHRHPEHGPGDPASVCRSSRVVGEVAGKARWPRSCCIPGGLPCLLGPGDGGHCGMPREPQGQATEPTKSAMDQAAEHGRLRCRVGWWSACGWGRACQHRPARSLHPGRGGRTRLPPRGPLVARFRLVPEVGVRPVGLWVRPSGAELWRNLWTVLWGFTVSSIWCQIESVSRRPFARRVQWLTHSVPASIGWPRRGISH